MDLKKTYLEKHFEKYFGNYSKPVHNKSELANLLNRKMTTFQIIKDAIHLNLYLSFENYNSKKRRKILTIARTLFIYFCHIHELNPSNLLSKGFNIKYYEEKYKKLINSDSKFIRARNEIEKIITEKMIKEKLKKMK